MSPGHDTLVISSLCTFVSDGASSQLIAKINSKTRAAFAKEDDLIYILSAAQTKTFGTPAANF